VGGALAIITLAAVWILIPNITTLKPKIQE